MKKQQLRTSCFSNSFFSKTSTVLLIYLFLFYQPVSLAAAPLNITLLDSLSGEVIIDKKITAYKKLSDGSLKWAKSLSTDSSGQTRFDLENLGNGSNYILAVKAFNNIKSYSREITQAGLFQFVVGKLKVKVLDANLLALSNKKIVVYEKVLEKYQWLSSGYSDEQGNIRFDLDGIGIQRHYYLKTQSPSDQTNKISEEIIKNGNFTFIVGNKPLNVVLLNGISNQPLVDIKITAMERLSSGKLRWVSSHTTDTQGKAVFDLDGLGKDRNYILRAKPYNGGSVYSKDLNNYGEFVFKVGTVAVSLIDKTTKNALLNKKLTAYEKSADGRLHWRKAGLTNPQGEVHFDLPSLGDGAIYVIKSYDIFGHKQKYYSAWIRQQGKVVMEVSPDDSFSLDLKPPQISLVNPEQNAQVSHLGILLKGKASDNNQIGKIVVFINDPIKGQIEGIAEYNNGYWQYQIAADVMTPGQEVTLDIRAYDSIENMTQLVANINIIDDKQAPIITISSQQNMQQVSNNGFLVSGNISDNTSIQQFTASISDASGLLIDQQKIQIANSGRWTLVIKNNLLNQKLSNNKLTLQFNASDFADNQSTQMLQLEAIDINQSGLHAINRITFGLTPELLKQVQENGFQSYLAQQMSPMSIDDSELDNFFGDWLPESRKQLIDYQLYYATYSKRQLLELMTWFWENHFSTDIRKTRKVSYEVADNQLFRQYALSNFKQLLSISATSPAMMIYLDNHKSRKQEPNENYARELLELHTMGVGGGYTAADIAAVARVFTGWKVRDKAFYFNPKSHNDEAAIVLGHEIPAGLGMQAGQQVLDILANHPSTANFICKKLTQVFISDQPQESIINSCSETFLQSSGDISAVLWTIFQSPEFNSINAFHNKVKSPIEYMATLMRNLSSVYSANDTRKAITNMDMAFFQYPIPTGWSETGKNWSNSNQLLVRMRFAQQVAFNKAHPRRTHIVDAVSFFRDLGYETSDGIVGYLFQLSMANDYSALEWQIASSILTEQDRLTFDIDAENADKQLRTLIATLLSFPTYQLQ
ncbi:MAG: DUF1800 family protein [Pseudomonadota bacterium]